jgi:hypothetical protein
MVWELQRLIVLPAAMIVFLFAASTSGLTWRTNPAIQVAAAR